MNSLYYYYHHQNVFGKPSDEESGTLHSLHDRIGRASLDGFFSIYHDQEIYIYYDVLQPYYYIITENS